MVRHCPFLFHLWLLSSVEQGQGTYPLPEAQLDRFLLRIQLDYPELEDERNILNTYKQAGNSSEAILSQETVLELQQEVSNIHIADDVKDYLLSIVHASRNHPESDLEQVRERHLHG